MYKKDFTEIRIEQSDLTGHVAICARDILEAVGYHHMGITEYCENVPDRYIVRTQFGTGFKPYVALTLEGALLMLDNLKPSNRISVDFTGE